jgi:NAD(P)H-hydrate epimerase
LASVPWTNGAYEKSSLKAVEGLLGASTVLVLGPGLGRAAGTRDFVRELLGAAKKRRLSCVVDADALTLLAPATGKKKRADFSHCVFTPHPGEMARLLGSTSDEVQADRFAAAKKLHQITGAVAVLKGAGSIVYHGGAGWVNSTGNAYMATAGSGDVLSGIIAGLLAQGMPIVEAAKSGVYAHGAAGDRAHARTRGPIIASDMIAELSPVMGALTR